MLKRYAVKMFDDWATAEHKKYLSLIEPANKIADLGCGDGELTLWFAKKAKSKKIVGVDSFKTTRRIEIVKGDLNQKLPLPSTSFDAVFSHFSLEHLYNTGMFISETHRILKKGGYTLVATDNMASWANIISLILGFQPFSTTCGITKGVVGNPFAIRADGKIKEVGKINKEWRKEGEYSHNKVLSYKALIDSYKEFGFEIEEIAGVGSLPFTGALSRIVEKMDKRHSHFLILKARKK